MHIKSTTKRLRPVHASVITSMDLIWQFDCRPQALASFLRIQVGLLELTVEHAEVLFPLSFAIAQGGCKQLKKLDVRLHRGRTPDNNTPVDLGIMQALGMALTVKTMPLFESFKLCLNQAQYMLGAGCVKSLLQGLAKDACPKLKELMLPQLQTGEDDFDTLADVLEARVEQGIEGLTEDPILCNICPFDGARRRITTCCLPTMRSLNLFHNRSRIYIECLAA